MQAQQQWNVQWLAPMLDWRILPVALPCYKLHPGLSGNGSAGNDGVDTKCQHSMQRL
jgi:hypothetical protein